MKNTIKAIITITAIGISLTACKHEIDKAVIQSCVNENAAFEEKISKMKTFKYQVISEMERKHTDMINKIDPKKKTAFEKDNTLKSEMNTLKGKMEKAAKEYESNYNALAKTIESNNVFISAIPTSEKNEDAIKFDWQQNMVVSNGIFETSNSLKKELNELSEKHNELVKQVIKKYGKAEDKKPIKKKKR